MGYREKKARICTLSGRDGDLDQLIIPCNRNQLEPLLSTRVT